MKKEQKKRVIMHFNNLPADIQEEVRKKYPDGFTDYKIKITKPNNDFFFAVPYDTEDISYLVKIDVKIDTVNDEKIDEQLFHNDEVMKADPKIKEEEEEEEEPDDKPEEPDDDDDDDE
ncbi:MAG: hypothetical protein WCM76_08775 [Bacteroidota bacterium]|jgi:hypothetical protein